MDSYIKAIKENFDSTPYETDFENNPVGSTDEINKWIEKSTNGVDFSSLESIDAIGNSTTPRSYFFEDNPENEKLFVLNGFGSRGVLIAPYTAMELFNFIERQKPLDSEIDIDRFQKKYFKNLP